MRTLIENRPPSGLKVWHQANHPVLESIHDYRNQAVVPKLRERRECMMCPSKSREEAKGPSKPLVNPEMKFAIGNRTMYAAGKANQIAREMKRTKIEILGISDSRWRGSGRTRRSTSETVVYSKKSDDFHSHGVKECGCITHQLVTNR